MIAKRDYSNAKSPRFYGWIKDLRFIGNSLYFLYADPEQITLYRLTDKGEEFVRQFPWPDAQKLVVSCRISPDLQRLYATTRKGEIIVHDGTRTSILYRGKASNTVADNGSAPSDLDLDNDGNIYFTDIASEKINKLTPAGDIATVIERSETYGTVPESINTYYNRLNVSDDGKSAYTTDQFALYVHTPGHVERIETARHDNWAIARYIALCACALYAAGCLLYFMCCWGRYLFRTRISSMTRKTLSILFISLVVSTIVSTPLIMDYYQTLNRQVLNTIGSVTYAASRTIDGDQLEAIKTLDDFDGPAYRHLRDAMDHFVEKSYEYDDNLYYSLYKTNGHDIYQVIDYEDTVSPLSVADEMYAGSEFEKAAQTRQTQLFHNVHDAAGVWTYGIAPVFNSNGNVAGFVEVGRNHYALQQNQYELLVDIILLVLTCVIIAMLCFTEGICFIDALKTKMAGIKRMGTAFRPGPEIIRPLTFCLLLAVQMESVFLPVYVSEIYTSIFGLPEMIGMGIPISAEVVTIGLFAVLGGFLEEKFGIRRLLFAGTGIAAAGYLLAASVPNVWVFTLGKLVAGSGVGIIFVSIDTFIAEQKDEETVHKGFVDYYASYFASINVGCIAGGVLAMFIGYRMTYMVTGFVMIGCLFIVALFFAREWRPIRKEEQSAQVSRLSTRSFLFNKRILSFFLCLYVPYLIASYFLHYFFPIFAHDNGVSEGRVAQVFLLNGLAVTYLGTYVTPRMVKWFGNAGAAAAGSFLCAGALALFVVNPSIGYAILVIAVLGLADSFSFSTQTSYFNDLKVVKQYGISKANGIKNIVENTAYASAPFVFGAALLCGITSGIGIIAAAFGALTGLFSLDFLRKKKKEA